MVRDPKACWEQCLQIIRERIADKQFMTWFTPITFRAYDASKNILLLRVPSDYFSQYVEEHFGSHLKVALKQVFGPGLRLQYSIPSSDTAQKDVVEKSEIADGGRKPRKASSLQDKLAIVDKQEVADLDSQLDLRMSFRNYIEGTSNKLARSIGIYSAEHPTSSKFNPMFIYGPSGCGKTHLINAIGLRAKELYPNKRVLYVSAREFQAQFVNALQNDIINDFIGFYQTIDVLIVDDVQEWVNSPKTQDTFFHIFDHLFRNRRRIVLACDRPPVELRNMKDRLITRFACGAITDIDRPDVQLCVDILHSFIRHNGIEGISEDVVMYIAKNANGSVRDLQGVINSLLARSLCYKSEIDIKLADKVIRSTVKIDHEPITINRIMDAVCGHFHVSVDDVNGMGRKQEIVLARQVSMYLAQKLSNMSNSSIGRLIGGRDHSTVIHSCRKIEKRLKTDKEFRAEVSVLEKDLK